MYPKWCTLLLRVLINMDYRCKVLESSPSYPSLLPECDLKKIPVVHFTFNVRQYTQESSFLTLRDKKPLKLEKSV